jgi:hypothetical protein
MNIINSNQLNNDINENSQEDKYNNEEENSNSDSSFDEFEEKISNIRSLIGNLNKKNNNSFDEEEEENNEKIKNLINSIHERDYIIQEFENLFKEIFEQTLFYKTQNTDLKLFLREYKRKNGLLNTKHYEKEKNKEEEEEEIEENLLNDNQTKLKGKKKENNLNQIYINEIESLNKELNNLDNQIKTDQENYKTNMEIIQNKVSSIEKFILNQNK